MQGLTAPSCTNSGGMSQAEINTLIGDYMAANPAPPQFPEYFVQSESPDNDGSFADNVYELLDQDSTGSGVKVGNGKIVAGNFDHQDNTAIQALAGHGFDKLFSGQHETFGEVFYIDQYGQLQIGSDANPQHHYHRIAKHGSFKSEVIFGANFGCIGVGAGEDFYVKTRDYQESFTIYAGQFGSRALMTFGANSLNPDTDYNKSWQPLRWYGKDIVNQNAAIFPNTMAFDNTHGLVMQVNGEWHRFLTELIEP